MSAKNRSSDVSAPQLMIIKPNSLVIYQPRKSFSGRHSSFSFSTDEETTTAKTAKQPTRKNISNGFLSDRAGNRLRTMIKFLLWTSGCYKIQGKRCDVRLSNKISFITLTLPASQEHSDVFIKDNCLNNFITQLSKKHVNIRYIWRAEKQSNGNIHFHFLVNRFVSFDWCQMVWNRILNNYGYIERYRRKFSVMSFADYCHNSPKFTIDKTPLFARRFARGTTEKWSNPPTINVKGLSSTRKALYYISKYISKNNEQPENLTEEQRERLKIKGHIWFCCYELSQIESPREMLSNAVLHDLNIVKRLAPDSIKHDDFISIIRLSIDQLFNLGCYNLFNIFVTSFGILNKNELFQPT